MTSRQANPAKPSHAKPPLSSLLLQPQRYQVGAPARHLHACIRVGACCASVWCVFQGAAAAQSPGVWCALYVHAAARRHSLVF